MARPYIDLNTKLWTKTKSDFEKDFFPSLWTIQCSQRLWKKQGTTETSRKWFSKSLLARGMNEKKKKKKKIN